MSFKTELRIAALILALACPASAGEQETRRLYLSGHGKDDAVPWQFFCTAGRNSGKWTTIPVPSNWELQGFGTFTYGVTLGRVPILPNAAQGRYKVDFQIPADWAKRRIFLVFEGVMTDTAARVNGRSAGPRHQGGYYRFKYEITRLVKLRGKNLLEVSVDEESGDPSVNAAERRGDYWNYAGIYRPVYLEAVPAEFIDRIALDARADGSIRIDVFADGIKDANAAEAQILSLDGHTVGNAFSQKIGAEKPEAHLQSQARSPRLWTAETPNLYQVEVRLKQGTEVLHAVRQRFGFRTVEVRPGDGIYVNGTRVLLKGTNRHTFWPDSGRTSSEKLSREDIRLLQDMNMNAVRMSHYPPDQHFLDACDEEGLYVLDELAGWQKRYDTPIGRKLVEEMVKRDVDHPSILFWDNGNEGGWNTELDGEFGRWDPQQRRVLHPRGKSGDVDTLHYPDFARFKALCGGNMVFMPTEFMHGLYDGGGGAGLEDYWNVMRESKVRGGGFIWSFVDEAVKRVDLDGRLDPHGNLAPDGVLGPYREREASYYTIKEIWSPVAVLERTLPEKFDGTLTVENRYDFTDLRECRFSWELRKLYRPNEKQDGFEALAKGAAEPAGSIPPGASGKLKLDLPENRKHADALSLTAWNPAGRGLWTWVWPLPDSDDFRKVPSVPRSGKITAEETADQLVVRAGELTLSFDKHTGFLASVARAGKAFSLANGPRPAAGEASLTGIEHHSEGGDYLVNVNYSGNMGPVCWRVRSNGWLQLDYSYNAAGAQDFFGVSFDYPEAAVQGMRWLGDGPYRVWKNRRMGTTFNVWQNRYNNAVTGAGPWTYPEFKGYYAGVRWVQLQTREGPITMVMGRDDLFLQVLVPEFPSANLAGRTFVRFPKAGISFLDAVPGMGSKFISAGNSGPQGEMTTAQGSYQGSVSFYFGEKIPK